MVLQKPKILRVPTWFKRLELGGLVGTQRKKAEHAIFESHFEKHASSMKRLHNARAKLCAEDHTTSF